MNDVNYPHPDMGRRVLNTGEHLGFKWAVMNNGYGYRCGYVAIPPSHKWFGEHYDNIEASVHGGLTFARVSVDGDRWWIGFDCGHLNDAPDPILPVLCPSIIMPKVEGSTVKTQEYAEAECRKLCEQAAALI